MKRILFWLALGGLLVGFLACAEKPPKVHSAPPPAKVVAKLPKPPAEGIELAKAAEKTAISGGPNTPSRKALAQEPQQRPCWAVPEGGCPPPPKAGFYAVVGTSSGAATADGSVLNAYQNAIETIAGQALKRIKDPSPSVRETARAKAYYESGVYDKHFTWMEGQWVQQWEERYRDEMRVYFRAFVLVYVPNAQMQEITP